MRERVAGRECGGAVGAAGAAPLSATRVGMGAPPAPPSPCPSRSAGQRMQSDQKKFLASECAMYSSSATKYCRGVHEGPGQA